MLLKYNFLAHKLQYGLFILLLNVELCKGFDGSL